jgi:hypothetical protein
LFAAGAATSAGAAMTIIAPAAEAAPARRLATIGAVAELVTIAAMEHRLDRAGVGAPYHESEAGEFGQAARALTVCGAMLLAAGARRSRPAAVAGGAMLLAGAACERWSVFRAGFQSAREPHATIGPQRRRVRAGRGHGASRHGADGSKRSRGSAEERAGTTS